MVAEIGPEGMWQEEVVFRENPDVLVDLSIGAADTIW